MLIEQILWTCCLITILLFSIIGMCHLITVYIFFIIEKKIYQNLQNKIGLSIQNIILCGHENKVFWQKREIHIQIMGIEFIS